MTGPDSAARASARRPPRPSLQRPPRLREVVEPVEVKLPASPTAPHHQPRSSLTKLLLIALLPSLLPPVAVGVATILTGAPSTVLLTSAALASSLALAVGITTVLSRRDEDARTKADEREYAASRKEFEARLAECAAQAEGHVRREARILQGDYPSADELIARTVQLAPSTWERRPADPDFLHLGVGEGPRPTCIRFAEVPPRGQHPDVDALTERLSRHQSAPLTVSLAPGVRAGIVGGGLVTPTLAWLILQAAAYHAPGELAVAVLSREEALCGWAKWLPHCVTRGPEGDLSLVARTGAEASRVLRAIVQCAAFYPAEGSGRACLIIADARDWESLPGRLRTWIRDGVPGVSVLVAQTGYEDLSGECEFVIELAEDGTGQIRRRLQTSAAERFTAAGVTPAGALRAALALAAVELADGTVQHAVPASVRLGDLLGRGDPATMTEAWDHTRRAFHLAAPLGIGGGNHVVEIDLRRDGPHALLAGTTGSGKSELLQSLVVSLAATVPPDLLNFLLVDYKGGSAFSEVAALPHVVGLVTDLDERLAARALTSLRAEMKRRERLLASVEPQATNIIEYQSRPRAVPLANLLIIIDEFHRLVSEQPDFIDQMVQIAQQGRALGVHLLLSTQKPSGVVTEHIRANTNLRICLRVTDEADSRDVLGGPEAAHIPRDLPGRAYIRTGAEPPRVVQTGRVSGMVPLRRPDGASVSAARFLPPLAPRAVRKHGMVARAVPVSPALPAEDEADAPELVDGRRLIVDAIRGAAAGAGYPPQDPPWQPYLPASLPLDALPSGNGDAAGAGIAIGLIDEPEFQRQRPLAVDLRAGHICIAGGADTGKTTALLAIAAGAAQHAQPADLHIYGIDFAGGALARASALPHCGGVAGQGDPASVRWVIEALKDTVAERLAQAAREGQPRVLVLVDNFPALYAALQNTDDSAAAADDLFELMDLGRNLGISFAVTAERPDSIRASILALMPTRLALHFADPEGYTSFGVTRATQSRETIPGRALVPGPVIHEAQIADPEPALCALAASTQANGGPPRIAPLPAEVRYADVLAAASGGDAGLLLGLRDGTRPLFRHAPDEHLLVLGPRRSGRSNALAVAVAERRRAGMPTLFVVNPRRSALLRAVAASGAAGGTAYAERVPDIAALWDEVARQAGERFRAFADGDDDACASPWAIVIDDADALDLPPDAADMLQRVVLYGADIGATLYVAADSQALRSAYPSGFTRTLLNLRAGVLLGPATAEDFDLLGVRGRPERTRPGRGYVCQGGTKHAVQVARIEGD